MKKRGTQERTYEMEKERGKKHNEDGKNEGIILNVGGLIKNAIM
jgi:hypothetical protein